MRRLLNYTTEGSRKRPLVMDIYWPDKAQNMPLVLFAHGFKGFKDWGPWELVAKAFDDAGMVFVKFNFSFNGGTKEQPIDFPDLEAFSENNYSTELNDLKMMVDWVDYTHVLPKDRMSQKIYLIGHSRGGGISILQAARDPRIDKLVTWAAIDDISGRFPGKPDLLTWKNEGARMIKNARTGQDMPMKYQIYEDWKENKGQLDISKAASQIDVPWLIVHGKEDQAVTVTSGRKLKRRSKCAETFLMEKEGHTFGASHPWTKDELPQGLEQVVKRSISFFNQ